jgi:predicted secreted protein
MTIGGIIFGACVARRFFWGERYEREGLTWLPLLVAMGVLRVLLLPGQGMALENSPHTIILTERDSGRTVDVRRHDTLVVKLVAQMGTGYGWQLKHACQAVKLLHPPTIEEPADSVPGGGEVQVFQFATKRTGKCLLEFVYGRSWEKNVKPTRIVAVHVRALEPAAQTR